MAEKAFGDYAYEMGLSEFRTGGGYRVYTLWESVRRVINGGGSGVFFPQNAEYVNTADLAVHIAGCHGKKLGCTSALNPAIAIGRKAGIGVLDKAFGSLVYEKYDTIDLVDFARGIEETEGLWRKKGY